MSYHRCAACKEWMTPGEAIRATERQSGREYLVHRPGINGGCLITVGPRQRTAIELLDPRAARLLDAAGTSGHASAPVGSERAGVPGAPGRTT
ncbi:MAG TPA: hypothetical protein VM305_02120 [Candidatus Limnocylindrales bacterium]|nr:hypothetical protein [Candidatus Limnocylindrales bacterium]